MPDLKDVVNTNKCILHLEKEGNKLLIISVIDNLLKGAFRTGSSQYEPAFRTSRKSGSATKGFGFLNYCKNESI